MAITNYMLRKNKYPIEVLEQNIDHLSITTLLHTQTLTAEFIKKYIMGVYSVPRYTITDIPYICLCQPHLLPSDLRLKKDPIDHLTDEDLDTQQYPIDVLEKNQQYLDIRAMVRTQVLTAEFCNKYILDEKYMSVEETYFIDIPYVLQHQPHLCRDDLWYPDTEDDSSEEENK